MIYLSLPILYNNFSINFFLKNYTTNKLKLEKEFKQKFQIENFYGNFPFTYWNGGINTNWEVNKTPLYDDIYNFIKILPAPLRLDCSNTLLTEKDLYDVHQNVILKLADSCGNHVEFSSLSVCRYIESNYQNFFLTLSKNADLIRPFDIDTINSFIDENTFYLIGLPDRLKKDENLLKKISNKTKIEITIGNRCRCNNIESFNSCIIQEHHNQIDFSNYSKFQGCPYINDYNNDNELLNEINYYSDLGFSHFKIDAPPIDKIDKYGTWLICNLMKPEYINTFFNKFSDWSQRK